MNTQKYTVAHAHRLSDCMKVRRKKKENLGSSSPCGGEASRTRQSDTPLIAERLKKGRVGSANNPFDADGHLKASALVA